MKSNNNIKNNNIKKESKNHHTREKSKSREEGFLRKKKAVDEQNRVEQKDGDAQHENELILQLQRLQAEFDNYQKRVVSERERTRRSIKKEILGAFLPILDNFELALKNASKSSSSECESFRKGVELIYAQCESILEQQGVSSMNMSDKFNPLFHEALLVENVPDREKGEILEVLQKGYLLDGELLRSAKVKVAGDLKEDGHKEAAPGASNES